MKKVAEYSNKGEMNLVSLRVMLYLTNEYDVSKKDTIVQSAEAIGANVGGYSYQMVRKYYLCFVVDLQIHSHIMMRMV